MKKVRRTIVTMPVLALGAFITGLPGWVAAQASTPSVEVWKSPTCGCCKDWVRHMQDNGFRVTVNDSGNTKARARVGIPRKLGSCHTAVVAGYAIEGHVLASQHDRDHADRRVPVVLPVCSVPNGAQAEIGRLLRLLFLWVGAVPTRSGEERALGSALRMPGEEGSDGS